MNMKVKRKLWNLTIYSQCLLGYEKNNHTVHIVAELKTVLIKMISVDT